MKIEAELIQASSNKKTKQPIYTFRLTYPRKHWLLDMLGLSERFEKWLAVTYVATSTEYADIVEKAYEQTSRSVYRSLATKISNRMDFARRIMGLSNLNGERARISGADVQKAVKLFGPRVNDVLKIYNPGEEHAPLEGHRYVATEWGWKAVVA